MKRDGIFMKVVRILLPLFVLAIAVGVTVWLIKTKPEARRQEPAKIVVAVETKQVESDRHSITIEAMGKVQPYEAVTLNPEVSGLVVWKSPNMIPGGIVQEGEPLLRIDKRNYSVAVKQSESALQQAEVEHQLELSRKKIAAEEWDMLGIEVTEGEAYKSLALREPQLAATLAKVDAAKNALARAELDMERTEIKAPFNAVVIDEYIDRGQLVTSQTRLAELAGTNAFLIEASLPVAALQKMEWPDENGAGGPTVIVDYDLGREESIEFEGRVVRVLGGLEVSGRLARVLVRVEDPFNLKSGDLKRRLFSGAYVRCLITGLPTEGTIELPSELIREGEHVWVMNAEKKLDIREVEVVWRQGGKTLISRGLEPGEKVVTSYIAVPMPGMALRDKDDPASEKPGKSEKGPTK